MVSGKPELNDRQVCLVVGCGRSGTSWLSQMIYAHPDVAAFEADGTDTFIQSYLMPMLRQYEKENLQFSAAGIERGVPSRYSREQFHQILRNLLLEYYEPLLRQRTRVIAQKSVDIGAAVSEIKGFLPSIKVVHIIRDGRLVCNSLIKERVKLGFPFGVEDVAEGAERWKERVSIYEHFGAENASSYLKIKYEELASNTASELSRIFRFLDVDDSFSVSQEIAESFHISRKPMQRPQLMRSEGKRVDAAAVLGPAKTRVFEALAWQHLIAHGYDVKKQSRLEQMLAWFFFS